jgi:hypothetical protein
MAKAGIPFSFLAILMYILPMAHAQPMAHPQMAMAPATRLDKLNVAASLHVFDKTLDRSAWESLGWGAFSLVVGIFLLSTGRFGWINLVFGLLIIIEGLYEKQVREPKVIKVSAATLGLLGVWNLAVFILAAMAKSRFVGGHPVVAVMQLLGAWNTYKSYAVYAALLAKSDPGANAEFKALLDQLKNADPKTAPDVAEFTVSKFGSNDVRWRVRSVDGLIFFLGNEVILGRKQSKPTCMFVPREQVKLDILGEKIFGSKQKVVVTAAGVPMKGTMSQEMTQKMQMLLV